MHRDAPSETQRTVAANRSKFAPTAVALAFAIAGLASCTAQVGGGEGEPFFPKTAGKGGTTTPPPGPVAGTGTSPTNNPPTNNPPTNNPPTNNPPTNGTDAGPPPSTPDGKPPTQTIDAAPPVTNPSKPDAAPPTTTPPTTTTLNVPTMHTFNNGGSVDISVDAPGAGTAVVNFSYLADYLRDGMACTLSANGSSASIMFEHTDHSFGQAAQSRTGTVTLVAGKNTLKLTCPATGMVEIKGTKVVLTTSGTTDPGNPDPGPVTPQPPANPCPDAESILGGGKCAGCHSGGNAMFIDLTSPDLKSRVLNVKSAWSNCNGKLLVDSDGNGVLVDALVGGGCVSLMPKGGSKLSDADITCVKKWAAWIAGK